MAPLKKINHLVKFLINNSVVTGVKKKLDFRF